MLNFIKPDCYFPMKYQLSDLAFFKTLRWHWTLSTDFLYFAKSFVLLWSLKFANIKEFHRGNFEL